MALSEDVHLIWLSAAIVLLTLLAISATPFLTEYIRKWNIMKPIPGFSPTYPIIGNALRFKPNGGVGSTILGKTADLTDVQKEVIDTLHKVGKLQNVIAKEAGLFTECCIQAY
ncbi:unnamed protein product [Ranitomeya imitator]|uniref:Uncharacterized protein n=1 Tax=Ranitomeya imitator TaxID=111125 RepID=A0ABN9MQL1_9NEOB|nr:unnamed protein product [Ranitomeya imitator]